MLKYINLKTFILLNPRQSTLCLNRPLFPNLNLRVTANYLCARTFIFHLGTNDYFYLFLWTVKTQPTELHLQNYDSEAGPGLVRPGDGG